MPTGYESFWLEEPDVDHATTLVEREDREELVSAIISAIHLLSLNGARGTACRLARATERVTGRCIPVPTHQR